MKKLYGIIIVLAAAVGISCSLASAKPQLSSVAAMANCYTCVHLPLSFTPKTKSLLKKGLPHNRQLATAACLGCSLNDGGGGWILDPGPWSGNVSGGDGGTIEDPGVDGLIGGGNDPEPSPCAGAEVCGDNGWGATVTGGDEVVTIGTNDSGGGDPYSNYCYTYPDDAVCQG